MAEGWPQRGLPASGGARHPGKLRKGSPRKGRGLSWAEACKAGPERKSKPRKDTLVNKILLVVIAILLPPLAVYLKTRSTKDTIINVILCFVFWVPAILHALWVVLK